MRFFGYFGAFFMIFGYFLNAEQISEERRHSNIGFGVANYHYEEDDIMRINSNAMYVLGISNYMHIDNFVFLTQADFGISSSSVYNGSTINITTRQTAPIRLDSFDAYALLEPQVGYGIDGDIFKGVLTIGLGFRYLYNEIDSRSAYSREQSYLYLPITFQGNIFFTNNFSFNFEGIYRWIFYGFNTSHFRELGYDRDLDFINQKGDGIKISAGFTYRAITLKAYYEFYRVEESSVEELTFRGESKGHFIEPRNFTSIIGGMIGFNF